MPALRASREASIKTTAPTRPSQMRRAASRTRDARCHHQSDRDHGRSRSPRSSQAAAHRHLSLTAGAVHSVVDNLVVRRLTNVHDGPARSVLRRVLAHRCPPHVVCVGHPVGERFGRKLLQQLQRCWQVSIGMLLHLGGLSNRSPCEVTRSPRRRPHKWDE